MLVVFGRLLPLSVEGSASSAMEISCALAKANLSSPARWPSSFAQVKNPYCEVANRIFYQRPSLEMLPFWALANVFYGPLSEGVEIATFSLWICFFGGCGCEVFFCALTENVAGDSCFAACACCDFWTETSS
jgi:hypothetical protein